MLFCLQIKAFHKRGTLSRHDMVVVSFFCSTFHHPKALPKLKLSINQQWQWEYN